MSAINPGMTAHSDRRARGVFLIGAAALVWSTGGLIVRSLEAADPWTTIFWRSATAILFLLVFMGFRDGRRTFALFRDMGGPGLLVGLCFAGASISLVVALSLTSVAETLVIMSSGPLVAAVLGRIFLGEPIRPTTWLTIAAVMVGIAIMVSSGLSAEGSLLGDAFAFLVALSYAGAIVTTRKYPHIRMMPAACTGAAIALLVAIPLASPLSVNAHDFALLFVFGAGQLGLGMALFVTGARLIPASQSALIGTLEPILGPAWVWIALGEQPPPATLVGGTIVIVSVVANTFADIRRAQETRPA